MQSDADRLRLRRAAHNAKLRAEWAELIEIMDNEISYTFGTDEERHRQDAKIAEVEAKILAALGAEGLAKLKDEVAVESDDWSDLVRRRERLDVIMFRVGKRIQEAQKG